MTKRYLNGTICFAAYCRYVKESFAPPAVASLENRKVIMYAVIETGGKQYKVAVNDEIFIEKLGVEAEDEVVFDKVIAVVDGDKLSVGAPYVEGAEVKATVLKNGKAKKITVFTYKPKKGYKRKLGHRQPYTKVRIDAINVK